jgi:hypothetical protein
LSFSDYKKIKKKYKKNFGDQKKISSKNRRAEKKFKKKLFSRKKISRKN